MDELKQDARYHIFDRIAQMHPRSVKEFNALFGGSIAEIAEFYGIVKVENYIILPSVMPFADSMPEKAVLFETAKESESEPLHIHYALEEDGTVQFYVYMEKGRKLPPEDRQELELIFRQYYYVYESIILRLSCRQLIMMDYNTGIPNSKSFFQFCNMVIAQGKIRKYTALYFNIHNFKSVHKSLSYLQGNDVMKLYCQIVANALTKEEMVARLGGDNFVALVYDQNIDYFFDLIQNMIIKYKKDDQVFTFSFGAYAGAVKLTDEKHAGEIMMHSSAAYQMARENRMRIAYYTPEITSRILERKMILSSFGAAIKKKEFYVVYQPKVDTATHTICGAEALVRWKREGVPVMPGQFIPVLEKDGCITALDFYVLEEVCRLLKKLKKDKIEPVCISVNFSKRHLSNNKLVEEILDVIDRYGISHELIKIELTESEDYHNNDVMKGVVEELEMHGIKTAIDDFGTGYSSLAMLNSLQLDELKIDRSFIPQGEIDHQGKSMLMLKGMVGLAKSLGLTIVAEGVETVPQLELIEGMGCDVIQGYIFDKPLEEEEFIRRLEQRTYTI